MNTRLLALVAFPLLLARPGHAQIVGFKGGVSVASASFRTSNTFASKNRTGFAGGMFLNLALGPLSIQPEISYADKGFNEASGRGALKLGYLSGTGLVKLGIPLSVVKPSVFVGVAYGIRTKCQLDGVDCASAGFETKKSETSGVFGADLAIFVGGLSLWGDGRYVVSFDDVRASGGPFKDLKNRAWLFQAGFGFRI